MEDYDGFLSKTTKIERTKIIPLRWIANLCSIIAIRSLNKAFDLQDQNNLGYRFKFHAKVWNTLNKPYMRWGTVYSIDFKNE